MWKPVWIGTLVAGVLDIIYAIVLTLALGGNVGSMLRFIASGPFPAAANWESAGMLIGLAVHFSLMAVMAAAYVFAAARFKNLIIQPVKWGVLYGLLTYVILDLLVVPLRFPKAWPPTTLSIATQLFAHVALVGIVLALITSKYLKKSEGGKPHFSAH